MSSEIFKIALKEVRVLKPRVVVLYHGGEPFVNKNILEMVKQLKLADVKFIKTVTNGMLLNDDLLFKIIESGLDRIEFSLDGRSAKENDTIRRGCSYSKVSLTIKKLISAKKYLKRNNPFICISNCQIPDENNFDKMPVIADYILKDFYQYTNNAELELRACHSIHWPGYPIARSRYKLNKPNKEKSNYCEHPLKLITIRHNGDIVACCQDITSMYILGNIQHHSIRELWNNERYRALRKSIINRDFLPLCRNCNIVNPNSGLIQSQQPLP